MSSVSKPKVYISFNIDEENTRRLSSSADFSVTKNFIPSREELLESVRGVNIIGTHALNNIDAEVINAAGPSLKVIATCTVGYNHIDITECKKRNIRVGYLGGLMGECMAEFTIGLMIATGRRFKESIADLPRGGWEDWSATYMNGFQLLNSTIGLVGLGNIGQELVKRLSTFNVKSILYSGPRRKPEGDALGVQYTTFENLLRKSDFVVVTCPLNDQTRGLFNRTAFNLMKPTSIFINVARGDIVDQEALYEALTTNKIFAAGLDVATPEPLPRGHPLIGLENCVLVPHIGTAVWGFRKEMQEKFEDNILAAVQGKTLLYELHL